MQFNSDPKTGGGSKNFLKLKDGQVVQGIFRGDVYEFYSKWEGGKGVECDENDPKAKFRFRINFILKEDGQLVSRIWEQGPTIYHILKDLHNDYDLTKTSVKIKRIGNDKNTTYTIIPMPKPVVEGEFLKQIEAIDLQPLETKSDTEHYDSGGHDDGFTANEIPPDFHNEEEIPF